MKLKNFLFIKKNKNTFFIKDGLIKYKITLNKFPKCICMKNNDFCDHLKFYLQIKKDSMRFELTTLSCLRFQIVRLKPLSQLSYNK